LDSLNNHLWPHVFNYIPEILMNDEVFRQRIVNESALSEIDLTWGGGQYHDSVLLL